MIGAKDLHQSGCSVEKSSHLYTNNLKNCSSELIWISVLFLTFCYLCSSDPCQIEELPLSLMMGWELGFGGRLLHSRPHVPASPFAPHCGASVFNMYESNWIIFMVAGLKWVRAGSNMLWSREGRGVGIWQPAAGWDCHGATDQPQWHRQGRTSFCQQEIETSLLLYRVLTTGLSNAVTGRNWL